MNGEFCFHSNRRICRSQTYTPHHTAFVHNMCTHYTLQVNRIQYSLFRALTLVTGALWIFLYDCIPNESWYIMKCLVWARNAPRNVSRVTERQYIANNDPTKISWILRSRGFCFEYFITQKNINNFNASNVGTLERNNSRCRSIQQRGCAFLCKRTRISPRMYTIY